MEGAPVYDTSKLKHVETMEKQVLPSSGEKPVYDVKKLRKVEIQETPAFPTSHEIPAYDTRKLRHVEITEKQVLPSTDDVKQEKEEMQFRDSIEKFEKGGLKHSLPAEKVTLPDATTIGHEKTLQGLEKFDKSQLKHTQTAESSPRTFATQEKAIHDVAAFDKSTLKRAETTEKTALPKTEEISQEKQEAAFRDSIEHFPKENLRHSFTSEKNVLPDASTIGHEKTLQNIEEFDKSTLKPTQTAESKGTVLATQEKAVHEIEEFDKKKLKRSNTMEKQQLPDQEAISAEKKEQEFRNSITGFDKMSLKPSDGSTSPRDAKLLKSQLSAEALTDIASFDKSQLKHAKTAESQGATLLAQEKAMSNIEQFDKGTLKYTETTEKQSLPDTDAISQEKKEVEFRESIENFPKENLRHSFTSEKNVLPDAYTIGHEKTLQNIEEFDKSTLNPTQTAESKGTVLATQEKAVHEIEGFDKTKLKRSNTLEKQQLPDKEAIDMEKKEEDFRTSIKGFRKDSLKHSHTAEKNVLPDVTQISKEKTLQDIEAFNKDNLKAVCKYF